MAWLERKHQRLALCVAVLLGCAWSSVFAQTADIMWRNMKTGENVIWQGGDYRNIQTVASTPLRWEVIGTSRNIYTGGASIIWRNKVDGRMQEWLGAQSEWAYSLPRDTYLRWTFGGAGIFDSGAGRGDYLWRDGSGHNMLWRLEADTKFLTTVRNMDWKIAGVGDFDKDGYSDILWRNSANGANVIWSHGDSRQSIAMPSLRLAYQVAGIGDFDGDGSTDILWREANTGQNVVWNMWADTTTVLRSAPTSWRVAGIGDFDADGRSDVLWRNAVSGKNVIWLGGDAAHPIAVATVTDPAWVVVAVADLTPRYI